MHMEEQTFCKFSMLKGSKTHVLDASAVVDAVQVHGDMVRCPWNAKCPRRPCLPLFGTLVLLRLRLLELLPAHRAHTGAAQAQGDKRQCGAGWACTSDAGSGTRTARCVDWVSSSSHIQADLRRRGTVYSLMLQTLSRDTCSHWINSQ